jgi:uncharacterized protein YjgD (DUF1641 family)
MAKPIPLQLPRRDPKQELLARLEQAPAEHAAALLDGYELLQQLHEQGVFTLVRGALGAKDKLVEAAAEGANSTESIRAIRNALILAKMLGAIDPEVMQAVSSSVSETFCNVKNTPEHPRGVFSLLVGFGSREHRRVLSLLSAFLKSLGSRLKTGNDANPSK